jgi:hypothetical protein
MRMVLDTDHLARFLHRREVGGHRLEARIFVLRQLEFTEDVPVGELGR